MLREGVDGRTNRDHVRDRLRCEPFCRAQATDHRLMFCRLRRGLSSLHGVVAESGSHSRVASGCSRQSRRVGHAPVTGERRRDAASGVCGSGGYRAGAPASRLRFGGDAAFDFVHRRLRHRGFIAFDIGYYRRLGWEPWRGRLAIRTEEGLELTPDEEVMIYRLPLTPKFDTNDLLTAEWRPGELW